MLWRGFLTKRCCACGDARVLNLKDPTLLCPFPCIIPWRESDFLTVEDLHGEALMLIREGWNHYVDELRHNLMDGHPEIKLIDF